MDVKDLLNIGFGVLNPVRDTLIGKNFDTSNAKPLDAMISSTEMAFSPDAGKGTGPYIGICLRVDGYLNEGAIDPTNTYTIVNESIRKNNQSEAPKLLQIRVRIPEIHSAIPIPQALPGLTETSSDHSIINLYPVFIAKDLMASSDTPQPGDMVWVDYQNTNTQEGPIYLGRVSNDTLVNGNSTTSGRSSFARSCTQKPAVSPPKTQPINASNSVASTNPVDMLNNAKKAYTPKPKQPASQNSVSQCGAVGAKYEVGVGGSAESKNYETTGTKDYGPASDKYLGQLDQYSYKRSKKIDLIVLHDGGPFAGDGAKTMITTCKARGVSTHYYINADGEVYQLMEESRVSYHTGTGDNPYWKKAHCNGRSIGIDLNPTAFAKGRSEGGGYKDTYAAKFYRDVNGKKWYPKDRNITRPHSKEQYKALKLLMKDICRRHKVPYNEDHILGHFSISSISGIKGDPDSVKTYKGNRRDPIFFDWSKVGLKNKYGPIAGTNSYGYLAMPPKSAKQKKKEYEKAVTEAVSDAAEATPGLPGFLGGGS